MMTRKQLERAAIRAHAVGGSWAEFWAQHADDVHALEPSSLHRHCKLVRRLSLLVVAGNLDGADPVPNGWSEPMPWEVDDGAPVVPALVTNDTTTRARLQLRFPQVNA
jgi:hypothetical protein